MKGEAEMSETVQSGTAEGVLELLDWVGSRGDMNPSTAKAYASAVAKVMEIEGEGWESHDVRSIDVEDLLGRFERLRATSYTPDSMTTYQSRFRKAHEMYMAFLSDGPAAVKALMKDRPRRAATDDKPKNNGNGNGGGGAKTPKADTPKPDADLVQYPFPLRSGQMAYLHLPRELPKAEAKRLCSFLDSLAIDGPLELMPGAGE
jgi:hypothetical protein